MPNPVSFDDPNALITGTAQAVGTLTSAKQFNLQHRGLKVWINISAIGATTNLTVTIRGYDPVTGGTVTILASAALTTTGESTLTVYPSLTAAANVTANDVLPPTWDITAAVAGTNTATFTVGFSKLA